jgi:hypothetical protein
MVHRAIFIFEGFSTAFAERLNRRDLFKLGWLEYADLAVRAGAGVPHPTGLRAGSDVRQSASEMLSYYYYNNKKTPMVPKPFGIISRGKSDLGVIRPSAGALPLTRAR